MGGPPLLLPLDKNPERTIEAAEAELLRRKLVEPGDRLVIVSDLLAGDGAVRLDPVEGRGRGGRADDVGTRDA